MSGVYKRGDILQVDFGTPPNEVKGHEQGMVRRATVWKSQERLGLLIVLPVTSKKPHYALYNIIEIQPSNTNGLTETSYVLCHQIRTISLKRIKGKRGSIDQENINKIIPVLKYTLEI
ncbi:MAG TPA: type II toxin-antitoxin system PemK/MazF family toxin [Flavobacteriales bacterium]|nr:type II toxin-antitoxin system PemK/MazF family toxin [Flavobacteriales bacterium]